MYSNCLFGFVPKGLFDDETVLSAEHPNEEMKMSYYKAGSKGNDVLKSDADEQLFIGLAGNDVLETSLNGADSMAAMFGGNGDDLYILNVAKGQVYISDLSGSDTLQLPFSADEIRTMTQHDDAMHAMVDDAHYAVQFYDGFSLLIKDFTGAGKIEEVRFGDGRSGSIDLLLDLFGKDNLHRLTAREADLTQEFALFARTDDMLAQVERNFSGVTVAEWFESESYIERHYAKLGKGKSLEDHVEAFMESGVIGREGEFYHFLEYGQWEDVSPMEEFDANYYYRAKAAKANGVSITNVSQEQALAMRDAIHDAGMNAWMHYTQYGTREGIDPSAKFNTGAYMQAKLRLEQQKNPEYVAEQMYEDFAAVGLNALAHYEAYGFAEGLVAVGVAAVVVEDAPAA